MNRKTQTASSVSISLSIDGSDIYSSLLFEINQDWNKVALDSNRHNSNYLNPLLTQSADNNNCFKDLSSRKIFPKICPFFGCRISHLQRLPWSQISLSWVSGASSSGNKRQEIRRKKGKFTFWHVQKHNQIV